jgi:sugar diacid utilization regulator
MDGFFAPRIWGVVMRCPGIKLVGMLQSNPGAEPMRVPTLSTRLREYMLQLAGDPTEVVLRIHALLAEHEEAYARLPAAATQDVLRFIEHCARLVFNALGTTELPSPAEWDVLSEVGRRRVHQGVPLPSVLRGFRFGGQEIWKACSAFPNPSKEENDELLLSVVGFVLEFFDSMSQTISQAYLDEQYQRARWRDALRYELVSIVFQFPGDVEGFKKAAESLGIDPTAPRIALALQVNLRSEHPSRMEAELDRFVLAASRKLKIAQEDLVRVYHRGYLVIWAPVMRGESVATADRWMADAAMQLVKAVPEIHCVGLGLMNQGPAGWAMSFDEASKALEYGLRTNSTSPVHVYSDISVNESVRRTDNVLRYLNSLLERLTAEPILLAALQSYFDHKQHRKMAADALGIHPNTLNQRLERIESILGANLEDAGWIAKLHIVLRLRQ